MQESQLRVEQIALLVGPVGLDEEGEGVLAQAVLHVVVEVGLLHAGEGALETFVVVWLAPWPWNVVRLFWLPLLVLVDRGQLAAHVVLGHGGRCLEMAPCGNRGARHVNLPTPPWEPLCALEEGQHGAGELCLRLPGQMALLCGHLLASGEWSCWDLSLKLPCLGFKPRPVMEFLPKPYWCAHTCWPHY